jgi:CheY-like chemotaxis protein
MPKILLVEDNEMNRDMLSRRLIRNGFEVVVAVDGGQAVTMAASENPDLILMDMSLPVIDGLEATRQVKASRTAKKRSPPAVTILIPNRSNCPGSWKRSRISWGETVRRAEGELAGPVAGMYAVLFLPPYQPMFRFVAGH